MADKFSDGAFFSRILSLDQFLDVPMQHYDRPVDAHVSQSSYSNREYRMHPLCLSQVDPKLHTSYQCFVQWLYKLGGRARYYQE
jgi:hypothetical protein